MGGPDDLCVPYKEMFDADAPAGGPCGKGGEPVCAGAQMAGAVNTPASSPGCFVLIYSLGKPSLPFPSSGEQGLMYLGLGAQASVPWVSH